MPAVNVLLFGHGITSEAVAQRVLSTPGIEVYSSAELGQSVDEQVTGRSDTPTRAADRSPLWDPSAAAARRDLAQQLY